MNTRIPSIIHRPEFKRLVKFGFVGAWGFAVNMFFLWFFTEIAGMYYLLSSIVAIEISLVNNFVFNDLWTWRDRGKTGKKEYLKRMLQYHVAAGVAMLVNICLLWVLTELAGFYYLVSNIFGILCGTVLNFFVNDRWTFKYRRNEPET